MSTIIDCKYMAKYRFLSSSMIDKFLKQRLHCLAGLRNIMPKGRVVQKSIKSFCLSEETDNVKDDNSEDGPQRPKRAKISKSASDSKSSDQSNAKPINKTDTDYSKINFECVKKSGDGKPYNLKISSWNIVSLKALSKKNGMEFVERESPDIMCFQETKCSEKNIPDVAKVPGYHRYFVTGENEGYAGVALYSKKKPIKVEFGLGDKEHDKEGRVITAEYDNFYLVTAYVPNSGRGLVTLPKRMKWDPVFRTYLKKLDDIKPVILCGDLNVAHNEIDLKNPSTNTKSAGFTKEERDNFSLLLKTGFIDTFRYFYPDKTGAYTYWNYIGNARSRNTGWRLDYFVVSERFINSVCDNVIRNEVYGSDHCPITLFLNV